MTGMVRGFGSYTLAGALVLGGIVFLAASQAQAQGWDDWLPNDIEGIGCENFEMVVEGHVYMCDYLFGELGEGDPSNCVVESAECQKLCNKNSKTCWKGSKAELKFIKKEINLATNMAKRLCKTTADPGLCKTALKTAKGVWKEAYKVVKAETKSQCKSDVLIGSCETVCLAAPGDDARYDFDTEIDLCNYEAPPA